MFTAAEILVKQSDAQGIAVIVDLTYCSHGVYIVRIVTTAGANAKRMIVG